MTRLVLDSK
ncbi:unnamed protein product [Larinioides sclopetarius]|uniref:Uncharacterized protein n=1 Tax=Larinioides sclopetarius TaxID=280406 RepID=A0AAV2B981_9ARAC